MFTRNLRSWIALLKEGEIFLAKDAYEENFSDMEEATFYQLLARVYKEKLIGKLAKGLYFKPYIEDYYREPEADKVIDFFTNKGKNGMLVGNYMFAKLGFIENPTGNYEVLTNAFDIKTQRIMHGVNVKTVQIDYKNPILVNNIELLETIDNIDQHMGKVDIQKLYLFMVDYALNYDQNALLKVLAAKRYKKRNIAIVMEILNHFRVQNTLNKLLNSASKYQNCQTITFALENGEERC